MVSKERNHKIFYVWAGVVLMSLAGCGSGDHGTLLSESGGNGDSGVSQDEDSASVVKEPLRILYIGDSQSSNTNMGVLTAKYLVDLELRCSGAPKVDEVSSFATPSAALRHWNDDSGFNKNWLCNRKTIYTNRTLASNMSGAELCGVTNSSSSILKGLVKEQNSNTIIIQLGDNTLGFSDSYVTKKVKKLFSEMESSTQCIWVLPTWGPKYATKKRHINQLIKTLSRDHNDRCQIIDTLEELRTQTKCSKFNSSDGLHMSSCGSKLWSEKVTEQLCRILRN